VLPFSVLLFASWIFTLHAVFYFCLFFLFFGYLRLGASQLAAFKNSCSTDEIMYTTPCPPLTARKKAESRKFWSAAAAAG